MVHMLHADGWIPRQQGTRHEAMEAMEAVEAVEARASSMVTSPFRLRATKKASLDSWTRVLVLDLA